MTDAQRSAGQYLPLAGRSAKFKHARSLLHWLWIILLFGHADLNAAEYYVAKDGNDTNDGSEAAPFLTISQAAAVMVAGDICYIKAGIYREILDPANHGTAEAPITFTAYGDDEVTISATEPLTGWEVDAGSVYRAAVDIPLDRRRQMLYYNGELMDIARWPNNIDHDRFTFEAVGVTGGNGSYLEVDDLPAEDWSGALVVYFGAHSGTTWTRPVLATDNKRIDFETVDTNRWPFSVHNPAVFRNGNRGQCYLLGARAALDYEREWFYDAAAQTAYLLAPDREDPNGAAVEYTTRERTIYLNRDYIIVDGINAFGAKVQIRGKYCRVSNGVFTHCAELLDELDNTDSQVPEGAIHVQAPYTLIDHNIIEYGAFNGIWIQGWGGVEQVTVRDNVVRFFNATGVHANGVRSGALQTRILHNSIYGVGRDGIYVSGPNSEIAYNDVSECMLINNDGGVFYTVGNDDDKNTSIHHNWFHDSYGPDYADGRAAGIYLDNDSKGYDVHHNVVWNITWSGCQMNWDAWNNDIFNNSFWQVGQAMGVWLNGRELINNRIWNNYAAVGDWEGNDFRANMINADNPFEDVNNKDFRPRAGSYLLDQGVIIDGITDDYLGSAPDIGAYEYGQDFWRAGADPQLLPTSTRQIETIKIMPAEVFPNPAHEAAQLRVELVEPGDLHLQLINLHGQLFTQWFKTNLGPGEQSVIIPVQGLPKGIYILNGKLKQYRFSRRLVVH